jgi:hypothetical protein
MPVPKQKRTTSTPDPSTSDPSSPVLPDQQVFHQYLRTLAQSAVRIVLETVMREELDQFIGAAWGECSRQQQRLPQWQLYARSDHSDGPTRRSEAYLEIEKASSTRRPLNETLATNRISRDQTQPDVCGRSEHPQSGRSGSNAAGGRSQCQHHQSTQPNAEPPI